MQRLPDRGLTKGLPGYYKRVYEVAYGDRPAVLIQLRDPAKRYVLNRYVEGMNAAASTRANAPALLVDDRARLRLVVSYEGPPVAEIEMAAEAVRQLRRLRDYRPHEHRVTPPRYVARAADIAGRHGELRRFARLYARLLEQLRRSQLVSRAGPGSRTPPCPTSVTATTGCRSWISTTTHPA
jgi:hypothetical protein